MLPVVALEGPGAAMLNVNELTWLFGTRTVPVLTPPPEIAMNEELPLCL
jgi:hypothetical protein